MSTIINNAVQNLNVMKKEFEKLNKPNPDQQQIAENTSHSNDSEFIKDTVVLQISSQSVVEFKPNSPGIKNEKEAEQLVKNIIEEIHSDRGKSFAKQAHHMNSGSVIDLLA